MDYSSIVRQLEEERDRLNEAIAALEGASRPARGRQRRGSGRRGRRRLSAEARRRISEAQKARWARQRKHKA
jgi:hypothetical protein